MAYTAAYFRMSYEERFLDSCIPEPNSGCWLWTHKFLRDGYGALNYHGKQQGAHRVAYQMFVGPIPDGLFVCHKCDVRCCVNPDHLFLGTNSDNILDMFRKGRKQNRRGEIHHHSRLTEAQVLEIKRDLNTTQVEFARRFGVSNNAVSRIRNGKTWSWLKENS